MSKSTPRLNQCVTTQFYFDESVISILQMNDSIALQAVFVTEMINGTAKSICKHTQIAHTQYFKQQSECV